MKAPRPSRAPEAGTNVAAAPSAVLELEADALLELSVGLLDPDAPRPVVWPAVFTGPVTIDENDSPRIVVVLEPTETTTLVRLPMAMVFRPEPRLGIVATDIWSVICKLFEACCNEPVGWLVTRGSRAGCEVTTDGCPVTTPREFVCVRKLVAPLLYGSVVTDVTETVAVPDDSVAVAVAVYVKVSSWSHSVGCCFASVFRHRPVGVMSVTYG